MNTVPLLAVSNRLRPSPYTRRVRQQGVSAFTVYNHMLLPAEFDSLEADYWHLCEHVQVWDVGAERQVEINGPDAHKLVQWMTPRDISAVDIGRCIYAPLADEQGFLINDPVALKLGNDHWWLSIADSDVLLWAKGLASAGKLDVTVREPEVWPLAVQGPKAEKLMVRVFGDEVNSIRFFRFKPLAFNDHVFNVARSGWSNQGGFEIYVDDAARGMQLYDALFSAGEDLQVKPGCPNLIERIEGSLLSFGNDMTMQHTVLEAGLDGFLNLDAPVCSMSIDALRSQQSQGLDRKLMGLVFPASDNTQQVATDPVTGSVFNHANEPVGRLGSQVWSPRYQHQLLTVMMEKAFYSDRPDSSLSAAPIKLKLDSGGSALARVLPLPFDFNAAGIAAARQTTKLV